MTDKELMPLELGTANQQNDKKDTRQMDYQIIRSRRRSIAIEIDRYSVITIRAPYRMTNSAIRQFVEEKQSWIEKHLEKIKQGQEAAEEIVPLTAECLEALFEEAKRDFPIRVRHFANIMDVTYGRITIRNQKTRWGSCSGKGNLNFNCLLMLAPEDVRDYVVIHELAHRKQMNHSEKFWNEVKRVMPDYNDKRRWLKEHGNELMQRMLQMRTFSSL